MTKHSQIPAPVPKSSSARNLKGKPQYRSDSREDDPHLEDVMQQYHRAVQRDAKEGEDDRVKTVEGKIGEEMGRKAEQLKNARPRRS